VTDAAARTTGHIAYVEPSGAGKPMILHGDTLAPHRTWKIELR